MKSGFALIRLSCLVFKAKTACWAARKAQGIRRKRPGDAKVSCGRLLSGRAQSPRLFFDTGIVLGSLNQCIEYVGWRSPARFRFTAAWSSAVSRPNRNVICFLMRCRLSP